MNPVITVLLVVLFAPLSLFGQDLGRLTVRDGNVRIVRGTSVLRSAEGMAIRPGDILETSERAFAQVELPGGALIAVGPSTTVYLQGRSAGATDIALLSGWLKGQTSAASGSYKYLTPLVSMATKDGTLVLHITPSQGDAFVEAGTANIAESRGGQPLKSGQFISRLPKKPPAVSSRMSQEFISGMPVPFRDTLPPRAAKFAGKNIEPAHDHDVTYPEISAWLTAPPGLRRGMFTRFEPRLSDAAFRSAVEAHIREYPEWDRVLHPEKYQPKASPASANAGTPPKR